MSTSWSVIKSLLSCTNGVHFNTDSTVASEKTRPVQPKILVLLINFFSLNFTSIGTEGEGVGSSQNERTLSGGASRKRTRANKGKQGGRGGGQNSGILSERTFWMSPTVHRSIKMKPIDVISDSYAE